MHVWRSIRSGIKFIWKGINLLREILFNLIFLFIIVSIFGVIGAFNSMLGGHNSNETKVLVLDLQGIIVDTTPYTQDFYKLHSKANGNKIDPMKENSLFELTQKIKQATLDPKVKGIILQLDNFYGADLSSLQYIGKYLKAFSLADKPIYAVGSNFSQSQYFLASYADKIYLTPQGSVSLYGLAANNLYYKTLLDNLKINNHIFRVGTYKSAIEPFIRNDMSPEARENTSRWLNLMWQNYLTSIATNRKLSPENLVPPADLFLSKLRDNEGSMTKYAQNNGIVDSILSYYQFNQKMHEFFDYALTVSIYDYYLDADRMRSFKNEKEKASKPLIAVVFINGTLANGPNANGIAGSNDIIEQLRNIRNNPNIAAVVLRINSPGGGVGASEAIRSELEALHSEIPIVVSMGNMAASGGYWIATESDYIVANENTITGSIGIFGVIFTFEKSLQHIGVSSDGISTSPLAGITISKDLPEQASELMQISIDNGYQSFISLVARSRKMQLNAVDKIAQGQVWLGEEAKKIGLVDQLGDFDDAIEMAAKLAKLKTYDIDWQQGDKSLFNAFLSNSSALLPQSTTEMLFNQLPITKQFQQQLSVLDSLNDPQNRYIYCLNCADVQ